MPRPCPLESLSGLPAVLSGLSHDTVDQHGTGGTSGIELGGRRESEGSVSPRFGGLSGGKEPSEFYARIETKPAVSGPGLTLT